MKLMDALAKSNCGIATCSSQKLKNTVVAMRYGTDSVRVIKGCTDPTVVRRVRIHEMKSDDWVPWDSQL